MSSVRGWSPAVAGQRGRKPMRFASRSDRNIIAVAKGSSWLFGFWVQGCFSGIRHACGRCTSARGPKSFWVQTAFSGDGTAACAYYLGAACTPKRKRRPVCRFIRAARRQPCTTVHPTGFTVVAQQCGCGPARVFPVRRRCGSHCAGQANWGIGCQQAGVGASVSGISPEYIRHPGQPVPNHGKEFCKSPDPNEKMGWMGSRVASFRGGVGPSRMGL